MKVVSVSGSGGVASTNVPKPRSVAKCVRTSIQRSAGPTIAWSLSVAPLDDRPAERIVVALERTHVQVALVESQALVGLHQRRAPDHVGEHHCDEPTIEPLTHGASFGPL